MGQGGQSVTTSAILLAYTHLGLLYRYRTLQLISGSIYRRGGDVLRLGSTAISLTNNSGDNEILSVVNIQYMVREPATDPVKWFVYVSPLRRVYRSSLTTTGLTLEEFVGSPPLVDRYNAGAANDYLVRGGLGINADFLPVIPGIRWDACLLYTSPSPRD